MSEPEPAGRDWAARAAEGEALAPQAGTAAVDDRVMQLLLDPWDTGVTYRTALALLARRDLIGLQLVVRASARAEGNTAQWLADAVLTFRGDSLGGDDEFLRTGLGHLSTDEPEPIRGAARELLAYVGL